MKIFKYQVPVDGRVHRLLLSTVNQILAVGNQEGNVVFWALVDDKHIQDTFWFKVFLTGEEVPDERSWSYVGTTTFDTPAIKPFVAHLFMVE